MAALNSVKEARTQEAISRAELARRTGLSDRTIKHVEEGTRNVAPLTKDKIVKGFNALPNKQRQYTREYLFPNG
jgi:transcriptional regulator with XRE-family HTH domain